MSRMNVAPRLAEARQMLRESGVDATIDVAGIAGEIAILRSGMGPPTAQELARLRGWSEAVKKLGFRYVTVDLGRASSGAI